MQLSTIVKSTATLFAALVIVAASPLVDADSGWKNTLGDFVWTGIFVAFAVLLLLAIAAVVRQLRPARDS